MLADLQSSLGKTRSVSPCLNGLITSHLSAKEPRDAPRDVVGFQSKFADKICEKVIEKMLANLRQATRFHISLLL